MHDLSKGVLHSWMVGEKRDKLCFIQITCGLHWQHALMSFKNTNEISSHPLPAQQISGVIYSHNKHIIVHRRCVHMCVSFNPQRDYNMISLESPWHEGINVKCHFTPLKDPSTDKRQSSTGNTHKRSRPQDSQTHSLTKQAICISLIHCCLVNQAFI